MSKYRYFGNSHSPHEWRVCPICGTDGWFRIENIYCSISCAKKANNTKHFNGTLTEYRRYHQQLRRKRGPADKCSNGCVAMQYTWANLTGKFEDLQDYVMMCTGCHYRFDRWRVAVIIDEMRKV